MKITPKKIFICEDHHIVVDGLQSIFDNNDAYSIIGYATNANDLFSAIKKITPDIILLDLNLPGKNGIEILPELKEKYSSIKVIVLTMYNQESIIKKVVKNQGDGFLLKNCSSLDLFEALEKVYVSDRFYLGEGVKKIYAQGIQDNNDDFLNRIKITPREKEIILELTHGLSVPQISKKLNISGFTIETHKKNIFRKLNLNTTVDLVTFVHENQLFQ